MNGSAMVVIELTCASTIACDSIPVRYPSLTERSFLYNASTNKLELLDFGASRAYPEEFITTYVRTLIAASRNDRQSCHDLSVKLGYLTGMEYIDRVRKA
jgi:predicted unusual protein kinase regulating ubiquinone biosynthesis (AarF/ABC1/UbiB family)